MTSDPNDDNEKPKCELVGRDGNAFAIIARVRRALLDADMRERAEEFLAATKFLKSYDELLVLVLDYVDAT